MRLAIFLVLSAAVAGCTTQLGSDRDNDGGRAIDASVDGGSIDAARGDDTGVDAPGNDAAVDDDVGVDAAVQDDAAVEIDAATNDAAPVLTCPVGPTGEIDLHLVTLSDNPPDLADWPITTTLTEVDFGDNVHVEFDKRDGPARWPDIMPPGWTGPLEYTLGMVECIDGQWYGSAAIQFWYGLDASGGNVALANQVAMNWYYDARWGALAGRQPVTGEMIGIFVVAGNARGVHTDDPAESPVMERSNVVLVPMPDVSGAMHSF